MCGITGVWERPGQTTADTDLRNMAGALLHRGPDGVGFYFDRRLAMAATRLAIIDLETGDQPIGNEDGRYWVMQNGEIYNAPELRAELSRLGHRFRTRCDTEVLVHGYEQWGADMLPRLNGAFAFAIWDRREESLFLARDRFGIRPLFLSEPDGPGVGRLVFGSEIKALLAHPAVVAEIDPAAISETFRLWSNSPERSAFVGIRELAPGHWMRITPDSRVEQRWWDLPFGTKAKLRSEEAAVEEVRALLDDATQLRLRSDVPVGVYLSGGLDSSATTVLVRRATGRAPQSFAVRFEDQRYDEREHQETMAAAVGADLSSIEVGGAEIAAVFPEVVRAAERPMLRTAPAPLFLLSRAVRDAGMKVVLTGEGADEVFAGYEIFKEMKLRRFWARQPNSVLRPRLFERLYPYLVRDGARAGAFMRSFFGAGLSDTKDPLYSHRIRFSNTGRLAALVNNPVDDRAEERLLARLPQRFGRMSALDQAQYLESTTFLQGYLLHSQGDRMLMSHSVEGRFPFLDHRLIELAAGLDDRLRMRVLEEKYLLRRAVAPLLPPEILNRRKRPYRAPILRAFVGDNAPDYTRRLLDQNHVQRSGVFNAKKVGRLVDKCRRRADAGVGEVEEMALVGVLSTLLLQERLIDTRQAHTVEPSKVVVGDRERTVTCS